jgi:hypothetical protein
MCPLPPEKSSIETNSVRRANPRITPATARMNEDIRVRTEPKSWTFQRYAVRQQGSGRWRPQVFPATPTRHSPLKGGQNWTPIRGQFSTPIDTEIKSPKRSWLSRTLLVAWCASDAPGRVQLKLGPRQLIHPAISFFEPVFAFHGPPAPWHGCRIHASRTSGGDCS